jgi:hypothetical protein
VDVNGNYSINVPTTDLRADPDLKIDGSIFARDAAGNTGTFSATRPYLVDNTGPSNTTTALSVNVVATDDIINATESGLASIPVTGKVTGEFKSGDVVTLTVNGKPFTGTVDASGNYSINVTTADLLADPDKTIAASIVATDAVGSNTIKLNLASVTQAEIYGAVHKLYIKGDNGDAVELTKPTNWNAAANPPTRVVSDVEYRVYQLNDEHELLINSAITNITFS